VVTARVFFDSVYGTNEAT